MINRDSKFIHFLFAYEIVDCKKVIQKCTNQTATIHCIAFKILFHNLLRNDTNRHYKNMKTARCIIKAPKDFDYYQTVYHTHCGILKCRNRVTKKNYVHKVTTHLNI